MSKMLFSVLVGLCLMGCEADRQEVGNGYPINPVPFTSVKVSDTIHVGGFSFDDTDVYKTIEGASYLLQTYPDERLKSYIAFGANYELPNATAYNETCAAIGMVYVNQRNCMVSIRL